MAIADHLKNPNNYLYLGEFFEKKRDRFNKGLSGTQFEPLPCHGTYFQLALYKGKRKNETDFELAKRLTIENGIATIPVSSFYNETFEHGLLRFCFAKSDETLDQSGQLLKKIAE